MLRKLVSKRRHQAFVFSVGWVLLASCTSTSGTAPPLYPTAPTLPTSLPVLASSSPLPELLRPTSQSTASVTISQHVVPVLPFTPEVASPQGTLIGRFADGSWGQLDLTSFATKPLAGSRPDFPQVQPAPVTPDHLMLAYVDFPSSEGLQVRTLDVEDQVDQPALLPTGKQWAVIGWLDDHRLALADGDARDGTVAVFDTSGSEAEIVPAPFEPVTEAGHLFSPAEMPFPFVYYDPTLEHVVVVRENGPFQLTYELLAADSGEIIWSRPGSFFTSARPYWSPDGRSFVVSVLDPTSEDESGLCNELLIVDEAGAARSLHRCVHGEVSWSPDGQHVSAWGVPAPESCPPPTSSALLIVFDREGAWDELLLCTEGSAISPAQAPIWSPDSKWLAVGGKDMDLEFVDVVLVNIVQSEAFLLPAAKQAVAWLERTS